MRGNHLFGQSSTWALSVKPAVKGVKSAMLVTLCAPIAARNRFEDLPLRTKKVVNF